jgi:tetratricopeptide (TPR) repeat protein
MIATLLIAWQLSAAAADPFGCTEGQLVALRSTQTMIARGDDGVLPQAVESAARERDAQCVLLQLQRLALAGWAEARAVAPKGGAPELLAPVRSSLNELEQLGAKAPVIALEVEYAQTAIRAAVAAAQDERPEMELFLTHARDLSERLADRGRRAFWPRPFNLLAGELWFEVDRFEDARAAYERAVRGEASALALVGLARAQARLGRRDQACATYKRVRDATAKLKGAAAEDLSSCR